VIERQYNFSVSDQELADDEWRCWTEQANNDHTWAFIHYCRRSGNKVYVKGNAEVLNVAIKRRYGDRNYTGVQQKAMQNLTDQAQQLGLGYCDQKDQGFT